jgi:hypothetical protein
MKQKDLQKKFIDKVEIFEDRETMPTRTKHDLQEQEFNYLGVENGMSGDNNV